jgi:hypothetical protein
MVMYLLSYSLFNLAGNVLDFSGILFSSAISLQVRVAGKFAGLLPDCAFDFVKLACRLIVRAQFHYDSLLCSVVAFGSLKFVNVSLRLDCLRPGKALFGKVSLPDVEPCIDQYRTIGLLIAGRNCSQGSAQQGGQTQAGLENVCLRRTSLRHRSAADLIDRRMPVTDVISQSPGHEQALAPRVFHSDRHAIASRVFDLKDHSIQQALAAKVFKLDHHTIERTPASKVFHLNRHDLAPRIFHLNHHIIGPSLTPKRFFSELR